MLTLFTLKALAIILGVIAILIYFKSTNSPSSYWIFLLLSAGIIWWYKTVINGLPAVWFYAVLAIWVLTAIIIVRLKHHPWWSIFMMVIMLISMSYCVHYSQIPAPVKNTTPPAVSSVNSADAEWEQWTIDRGNNRLIATGISGNTPQEVLNNKLNLAKHDAVSLVAYAYQARLIDSENIDKVKYLTSDGKYLNSDGRALWYQLKGNLAGTENVITNAPATSINSGTNGTEYVVDSEAGISGDTTALQTKYPNGNVTYTLTRCGNPVYNGDQDIKKGGTDETIDRKKKKEEEKKKKEKEEDLTAKNIRQDIQSNPKVSDWKKDDITVSNDRTVTNSGGAKVSNGLQTAPKTDAKKAETAAKEEAAKTEAAQQESIDDAKSSDGAGVVDSDEDIGSISSPGSGW